MNKYLLILLSCTLVLSKLGYAQEYQKLNPEDFEKASDMTETGNPAIHQEPADIRVTVTASEDASALNGMSTFSRSQLDRLNVPSGSINDALRYLPDAQFDYESRDSLKGGEILPPQISLSGGKPYENLYLIDGIGANNYINPTQSPGGYVSPPTSTPSALNLDIELLDNITVLSSRISAEYSGFTGGIVSADIRKPSTGQFFGKASYMTTRSEWTQQHVPEGQEADFINSSSADMQPEFEIHRANLWMNIPLSKRLAALVSYNLNYSKIPLKYNEASGTSTRAQHRSSQTFLAKVSAFLNNDFTIDTMVVYTPYKAEFFEDARRNCDWELVQDTLSVQTEAEKKFSFGQLSMQLAYSKQKVNRDANSNISYSWRTSESKDWGTGIFAYEGAYGDYNTEQGHFTFKLDFKANQIKTGSLTHSLQAGLAWERIDGDMYESERTSYTGPMLSDIVQGGPDGVVAGEQYFRGKSYNPETRLSGNFATSGLYVEDQISFGERLVIRPGLRLSHDDLFENLNLAPRLSALWRILPNERLSLAAGVNRYYGTPMLSYILRRNVGTTNYSRKLNSDGTLTDWVASTSTRNTTFNAKDLATPYSDEISIEPSARLFGFDLSFEFLYRRSRDGISRSYVKNSDGSSSYNANNAGRSEYTAYTVKLARTFFRTHTASLTFTSSKTKSNYEDFDTQLDSDYDSANYDMSRVYFNDRLIAREDLPSRNYNRPWRIIGRYDARFFDRLDLSVTATYEDTADRILTGSPSRVTTPDGASVSNLYGATIDSTLTVDFRLAYDLIRKRSNIGARLIFEISNLFDDVAVIRYQSSAISTTAYYSTGRQYWAGIEISF